MAVLEDPVEEVAVDSLQCLEETHRCRGQQKWLQQGAVVPSCKTPLRAPLPQDLGEAL